MLVPKLVTTMKSYSWELFRKDLTAGVIVGVVSLPLAIAFAIASGVTPDRGLVTAIIAGFIISALGGSRVAIGGPSGAFVVILYTVVQKFGMDGLLAATLLAGIILLVMGYGRFGAAIKFIPYPVTIGFTSGIALVIMSSQVKDFFGLSMGTIPGMFLEKFHAYATNFHTWNPWAIVVSGGTVLIILLWQRYNKAIPGALVALILATLGTSLFHLPVETIGSRFGGFPHSLPMPSFPHLSFSLLCQVLPSAFAIAMLGGIESLLCCVVADGMIGSRHRSNMVLVAQGAANIASVFFGGIPAAAAIARTAANVHNGGRTPVAGIVHAVTLFLVLVFLGGLAQAIPLASLAGILVVVSYRMGEWQSFGFVLRSCKSDAGVLLMTFFLTIFVDLVSAIEIGLVMASFLFVHRVAESQNIRVITGEFSDEEEGSELNAIAKHLVPNGVEIFEITGSFFFGTASTFIETMRDLRRKPKVRILRMNDVLSIDATAVNALCQIRKFCVSEKIKLYLSGVHAQPVILLERLGFLEKLGEENIFGNIDDALAAAQKFIAAGDVASA